MRGWHFITKINDLVITISWLLATTLLCFLTISILGTDRPFKVIQPNIHPKLRIWQYPTDKSGASGQKCLRGLPPSLSIEKQTAPPKQSLGAPGHSYCSKGKGWQLLAGPVGSSSGAHSSLVLPLFLKTRTASDLDWTKAKAGTALESVEADWWQAGSTEGNHWKMPLKQEGLRILWKLTSGTWLNMQRGLWQPGCGCREGLNLHEAASRLVSGTYLVVWSPLPPPQQLEGLYNLGLALHGSGASSLKSQWKNLSPQLPLHTFPFKASPTPPPLCKWLPPPWLWTHSALKARLLWQGHTDSSFPLLQNLLFVFQSQALTPGARILFTCVCWFVTHLASATVRVEATLAIFWLGIPQV